MDFTRIYKNWGVHNVIAHPLMYFISSFNKSIADRLHDATLPVNNKI